MEDAPISHPKVDKFKKLYKTIICDLPAIIGQPSTSDNQKFTPAAMPNIDTNGPIELVLDSDTPTCLTNGLDAFVNGLDEDHLVADLLSKADLKVDYALEAVGDVTIRRETSVFLGFTLIVADPVRHFCRILGVDTYYSEGPRVQNLSPDYAWFVQDEPVMIFAEKTPAVFNLHSPQICSMARQRQTLDLAKASESILAKLILASLAKDCKYCVLHSLTSFIVIRLVRDPGSGRYQVRISDVIPLTSSTTPIISLVLALILHSRQDDLGLEYQPLVLSLATSNNPSFKQDEGPPPEPSTAEPHESTNRREDVLPRKPARGQTLAPSRLALSEYWEPKEISQATLAAMLNTKNHISLSWDMKPFSRDVFHPVRRNDSSLWADSPSSKDIPRLILDSPENHHEASPPSPSIIPFVLRLNSTAGDGAIGTAYQGHFLGLSLPIIVKILPADRMDHELEMWRALRNLAGIGVPDLFGAYSLEGQDGREDTGALVQQYAGATLESFDT
ncbi:hypothetical protein FRC04_003386 [Tulasnella sp. 424]|nr:hypothetical protein FRC04_003386 [Tulasnella sp. 424]KAG8977200.1 hypothetical protein FRC05_002199 [Tulasnella sp. 425]